MGVNKLIALTGKALPVIPLPVAIGVIKDPLDRMINQAWFDVELCAVLDHQFMLEAEVRFVAGFAAEEASAASIILERFRMNSSSLMLGK